MQTREYQDFIEEFNVLEFRIPRNTRTNRTQLYAYVYFKDRESFCPAHTLIISQLILESSDIY
ncbi:hypothetical protein RhiirA5_444629 [Rhizophagus irregularis]|uniref:Uncharacterized protein n=1 Tax=Rhizophagus irregularis TaxID=588596 RepID=A0A2N0NCZ1_9GLOM|nr:hypothetical protein RhiirA5_444629 [Rhizophagus irregularis]